MRWIDYYQKYGEAPAKARRNSRPTLKKLQSQEEGLFTQRDELVLKEIIDSNPQLYLDEIQTEMARRTTNIGALLPFGESYTKLDILSRKLCLELNNKMNLRWMHTSIE